MSQTTTQQVAHGLLLSNLEVAARYSKWDKVFSLLDSNQIHPDSVLIESRGTLMHFAASDGNVDALRKLKARGAHFEGVYNRNGKDVLHEAVAGGKQAAVLWLLQEGVDINNRIKDVRPKRIVPSGYWYQPIQRYAPLHQAIRRNDPRMLDLLLRMGADTDVRDGDGNTPLMQISRSAAVANTRRLMYALIAYGADLDAVNDKGETAVSRALNAGSSKEHLAVLQDAGALLDNPEAAKSLEDVVAFNASTAEYLASRRSIPAIDLEKPFTKADLFTENAHGFTPLDNRATWQNIGAVMQRLEAQGEPLTKAELLQPRDQKPCWLERAIECRSYTALADALYAQGTPVSGKDFANGDGSLNAVGATAYRRYLGLNELGEPQYWQKRPAGEFQQFCDELPAPLREQITNRTRLGIELAQNEAVSRGR